MDSYRGAEVGGVPRGKPRLQDGDAFADLVASEQRLKVFVHRRDALHSSIEGHRSEDGGGYCFSFVCCHVRFHGVKLKPNRFGLQTLSS